MTDRNHATKQSTKQDKESIKEKISKSLFNNMVIVIFVILCLIGVKLSQLPTAFIVKELVTRLTRNSFLVLSLIIPVLAGMGLNFSIVVGAMAGQIAIVAVTHWGVTGLPGFLLCVVLSMPVALIFGNLTGRLLNKTKGQEMIASMIVGFFANGLYQLLFLFLVGKIIPVKNPVLILNGGVGVRNTIDLSGGVKPTGIKYALDSLWQVPVFKVVVAGACLTVVYCIYKVILEKKKETGTYYLFKYGFIGSVAVAAGVISMNILQGKNLLKAIKLPVVTVCVIGGLCLFNVLILKTKIGQDFRTVGQDKHIAKIAGINVDKTRILAITISTLLAAWGQLIFLQNLGTLNTYGSHEQIGMFSIAALLIGGASVSKATIGQALLGTALFHTLFIVSPLAGKNLFGDAQIGEFFRVFVVYGVIGVSLGLHAWKKRMTAKTKARA